ncbi:MAG: S-methyl-5'-thioadenosine phosphorylase [Verrucomicrobiota bacterium]
MATETSDAPAVGIIGGSGIYEIDGFEHTGTTTVSTPFGDPSEAITGGFLHGRRVWFLPRHGAGHTLMPHEVPHRANIWALRSLGVRWLVSVSAVGSLCDEMAPRHLVVPDQMIDRTGTSAIHTFFGNGIVAHFSFAEPYCAELRRLMVDAAREECGSVHDGGTYLCINGPAFSTRAEAEMHRKIGANIIGMTNAPECRLAREAGIAMATLALVTDYDCWKSGQPHVDAASVAAVMKTNSIAAKSILRRLIPRIPSAPTSPAHTAISSAVMTPRHLWPQKTADDLAPFLPQDFA